MTSSGVSALNAVAATVQCTYAQQDVIVVTQYELGAAEWSSDLRTRKEPRQ